ncbi:MAG: rRNA maturation RNase YbeY [Candidatus Marinimicrobia bacterium]|nr:rRNA maturation RNase YbeY [Candidatus Neomarinimicrobiota bacterium]
MNQAIEFFRESSVEITLDEDEAKRIITAVMTDLGYPEFSINIISLEDDALREIKKEYFQQDVFTDIISFNIDQEPLEGELYISPERIRQNAVKFKQAVDREFARILIHGACHLCGYDDISEEEKKEMTALENRFLTQYFNK